MIGAQYFFVAAVVVSALAAWSDWRTGEIPNWMTLGPLLVAPVAHAVVNYVYAGSSAALEAGLFSVLGAVACGAVPLILYRFEAIGGGDIKLLAAMGAICRPMVGIECEFYAFIAAAIYAPGRLAFQGKLMTVLGNTLALVVNPFLPKKRRRELSPEMLTELRFGPSVFAGTVIAVFLNWRAP